MIYNSGDHRLSASKIWTALTFVKNNFPVFSITEQESKMFPEIDFFIFYDYFLSFYRLRCECHLLSILPLSGHLGLIFCKSTFLSKEKYISQTIKFSLDFG
jgi:hypothetical protein